MAEPPDAAARARIAADLGTSLLVEAGAGSGKTAAMVGRMVALVRTGLATVDRIAAVTFTRKAAGELRGRFHQALARSLAESPADAPERPRLARALADPDGAFVGTVHAFCARLLRERPLEAGLPPDFREVDEGDEERLFAEGWSRFLDHLHARPSRLPARLARVGLWPEQLRDVARHVAARPDVRFSAPSALRADSASIAVVRAELEALLDASLVHLPTDAPARGWDPLQARLVALRFSRSIPGWDDEPAFFDALATAVLGAADVTLNRWAPDVDARDLEARWAAFGADGSGARALLDAWLAHRYAPALRLARGAAAFCARERRRAGVATFDDLLALSASLLRRSEAARRELGARWTHLLVDEFQDTDPLQAEVLFLLAAADPAVDDWRRATPRPGALFAVGDPKQSIYRFRRADLAVYQPVKARFAAFGAVLELTTSFRASPAVAAFVNRVFAERFPPTDQVRQPAFAPLVAAREKERGRVGWYGVTPGPGRVTGRSVAVADAAVLASWIAARVASGERTPGDFMVLTRTRHHLAEYARALEARGVPVHLAGAAATGDEARELALLLRALDDPGDAVRTVAVLEGPFFGLSHDDLHAHAAAGGAFCFTACPSAPGPVASALVELREITAMAAALPPDAAVDAIVDRIGLLPFAAAGESGASRTDAVLRSLDALREPLPASLAEAAGRLERASDPDGDASGRADGAVRVMNLHRAKGLESPVVILACPAPAAAGPPPEFAVEHGPDGVVRGSLLVRDGSRRADGVLARPARWREHAAAEAGWSEAEELRLLYVAATRARDELVVARCGRTAKTSAWSAFHAALDDPALAAELPVRAAPSAPAPAPEPEAASILARIAALADRRREMARRRHRIESFGSIEHRGSGDRHPHGSAEIASARFRGSALWTRAEAAEHRLIDVPFAMRLTPGEARELGLWRDTSGAEASDEEADDDVRVEGMIPLGFRDAGAWTVVAFDEDPASDAEVASALDRARRSLRVYGFCLARVTGEPVGARIVLTSAGREVIA